MIDPNSNIRFNSK